MPSKVARDLLYRKSEGEIRSYVWKVLTHSGVYQYESDYDELLDALIAAVREEERKALLCPMCRGTGRRVVGEHETLTNEWVADWGPCDHGVMS
jgi:hypothetical protein